MPDGQPPTWCWLSLHGHRRCIHCPHHEPANGRKQPKLAKAVCPLNWTMCRFPRAEDCHLTGSEGHNWLLTMIFDVRLTFTLYLLLRCHRSTATRMEFFMRFDTTCGGSCAHACHQREKSRQRTCSLHAWLHGSGTFVHLPYELLHHRCHPDGRAMAWWRRLCPMLL